MFQAPVSESKVRNETSRSHPSATKMGPELSPRVARSTSPPIAAYLGPPRIRPTPSLQSRASVQRKCACGGTCSHCQEDKDLAATLQTKLKIGAVHDPLEKEADHVAAAVMRMPSAAPMLGTGDQRIQRSSCGACHEPEVHDGTIRRAPANGSGGRTPHLTATTLTRGGLTLPQDVRQFFEGRFERDFSRVRVHTGAESNELNAALQAHAFAYENHIWLGPGHPVAASALMAHELAHVVQQSGSAERPVGISADMHGMVRMAPSYWYFEPPGTDGTQTHARVLPAVVRANPGLLNEVPCPKGADGLEQGRADLYMPTPMAVFGVWYGLKQNRKKGVSEQKTYEEFHNLPRRKALKGIVYAPTVPDYDPRHQTQTLRDVDQAPKRILVGDLKPIGEEAHKGVDQVQGYIAGLNNVGLRVTEAGYSHYTLKAGPLASLRPPAEFDVSNVGAPRETLWVKKATPRRGEVIDEIRGRVAIDRRPLENVRGRLVFQRDPQFGNDGIYNHFWVPDAVHAAELPRELRNLNDERLQGLILSLRRVPVGIQRKALADSITQASPRVMRDSDKEAPKGIHVKDPFDYGAWKQELESFSGAFAKAEKVPGNAGALREIEAVSSALEGLHAVGQAKNIEIPKDASKVKRLEFWSGKIPPFLGKFRQMFGAAFVNIARLFLWGREKFRTVIKNNQKEAPGPTSGPIGAIVKILFRVAKFTLATMLPQITNRLWMSLTTGVKQKLLSLIPDSIVEEYDARKEQFEGVMKDLHELAENPVLEWLQKLVQGVEDVLEKIGQLAADLSKLKEIVDDVRTAIQVLNCAAAVEGDVVGCVLSFVRPVVDLAISKAAESCLVRRYITPHLVKLDFIRKTAPNLIADSLIGFAREHLPKGWQGLLADLDHSEYVSNPGDIPCNDEPSPVERAMDTLANELGNDEDKIFALSELMNALGGDDLKNVTAEQILELAGTIRTLDISAEKIREYARNVKTPPKDIPAAFRQSVQEMFQSAAKGETPPQEYDIGGTGAAGNPDGHGQGGGRDAGHGASSPDTETIEAKKDLYYGPSSHVRAPRSGFKVVPAESNLKVGKDTSVDVIGFWDSKVWKTIVGVPVTVLSIDAHLIRFKMNLSKGIIIGPQGVHLEPTSILCHWKGAAGDTRDCPWPRTGSK